MLEGKVAVQSSWGGVCNQVCWISWHQTSPHKDIASLQQASMEAHSLGDFLRGPERSQTGVRLMLHCTELCFPAFCWQNIHWKLQSERWKKIWGASIWFSFVFFKCIHISKYSYIFSSNFKFYFLNLWVLASPFFLSLIIFVFSYFSFWTLGCFIK